MSRLNEQYAAEYARMHFSENSIGVEGGLSTALLPDTQTELLSFEPRGIYCDEDSERDDASIFSIDSIASTASSVSGSGTSVYRLSIVCEISAKLFHSDDLRSILVAALEDANIDRERLLRNIGRSVRIFGKDLKTEALSASERSIAYAMQTRSVAARAAREAILPLRFDITQETSLDTLNLVVAENRDQASDTEIESVSEDDDSDSEINTTSMHDFLFGSNSFALFKNVY